MCILNETKITIDSANDEEKNHTDLIQVKLISSEYWRINRIILSSFS